MISWRACILTKQTFLQTTQEQVQEESCAMQQGMSETTEQGAGLHDSAPITTIAARSLSRPLRSEDFKTTKQPSSPPERRKKFYLL